ncbi:MAG: Flp pilus assembly protein CpaB [Chloroflexi bacterium]|nr:Flp pilus assembly protein CpaB [Chloroflexota bacterium]
MAVTALSPARAIRRPRRADPRALIGVFLTLAALAGSVAFWVTASEARPVVVATRDLPAGATLQNSDLTVAYVRMDDALYRAATPSEMLDSLVGRQLAEPMHAQQVLARAQLEDHSGLGRDQVAITIPAHPDTAVDGRIRAGDQVQILVTVTDKNVSEAHTRLVLARAQVFEVGREQGFGASSTTSSESADANAHGSISSITLALSPEDARSLAEARRSGDLDVLLLPPESDNP